MKKILCLLVFIRLTTIFSYAQFAPYPILPIDSIQFVNQARLLDSTANTLPDYTTPVFKNTTYQDTVTFEGVVVTNPKIYGLSANRKAAYMQRIGGGPWSSVLVMCEPSGTGTTLANLLTETNFYQNFVRGKRVRVTGVIRDFQGETQINLIRNNSNFSNAVELLSLNDTTITYSEIPVSDLIQGGQTSSPLAQKQTAERWEGAPVIIRNVIVNSITTSGNRSFWTVRDNLGNVIDVRDFSAYFRRDDNEDTLPKVANTFQPPPVGTPLTYIRGIVTEFMSSGSRRYGIAPQYNADVKICDSPCVAITISSVACAFINSNSNISVSQFNVLNDTAYLEYSLNPLFTSLAKIDTIRSFGPSVTSINSTLNITPGTYYIRLRLKNGGISSNTLMQKVSAPINLNIADTSIAFKQDSILLTAPAGAYTYLWNNGRTTQNIWVKFNGNFTVKVQDQNGCSATDSTQVLIVKGIQQKDTTICAGSSINLFIPGNLPKNGLVGWWPFNGNANDESGNGNNGTVNGATLTTDRFGNTSKAYSFDGNDYILSNSFIINLPFTSSFWIEPSSTINLSNISTQANSGATILSKGASNSPCNYADFACGFKSGNYGSGELNCTSNSWLESEFGFGCNFTYVSNCNPSMALSSSWKNITIVASPNKIKRYLNGIFLDSLNTSIISVSNSGFPLSIGARYVANNPNQFGYWNGKIDDIGIWNRALTQQEITALYNGSANTQSKVQWSTNDTTTSITVSPTANTTYRCTQRIGSFTFTDSIRVSVATLPALPDTSIAFKADSILLDAGAGHTKYVWSTGDTTQTIWAKNASVYKVTVQNAAGCSATDSTQVLIVKGIQQKDTTICTGNSINLFIPGNFPKNGLVGWWPFNGNANDESGNGNNGTVNGATLTTDRFGNTSKAYSFDGVNDYINLGPYILNQPQEYTIDLWSKFNNATSSYLFGQATNGEIQLALDGSGNVISWNKLTNGGSISLGTQIPDFSNWHHITAVFNNNTKILKFILDGVAFSTTIPQGVNIENFSGPALFGRQSNLNANFFNGQLDNIGIWNRALTQQEITALYNDNGSVNTQSKVQWSTNDTTTSITVSPTANTTYRCTQRIGSFSFTDSVRVSLRNLPDKIVSTPKLGLCKNDNIALTAASGYTYQWKRGNNNLAQTQILNVAEAGAYTVTLSDNVGCKNTSDTIRIFNNPHPKSIIATKDSGQCIRGNLFIFKDSTQLDSGSYTVQWNFGNGVTSTLSNPGNSYTAVGVYPVKLISTTNYGCKDSIVRQVIVHPNPTTGPMLGDSFNLKTSTPYFYTIAQQLNHSYNWQINNGIVVAGQNTNAATVQWLSNGSGSVKVVVTNPQGCTDTSSKQVSIGNVGLNKLSTLRAFYVYPNPSNGGFTISMQAKNATAVETRLVNLLGQTVWSQSSTLQAGENELTVNAPLAPGMYTLIVDENNNRLQQKIVIK